MSEVKMALCILNGKYQIVLPEHRANRPEWYRPEGWEKARLESLHANVKKGDVVYYVGAEEGDMCGLLGLWGAGLAMFEPNERVWPNIRAIWEANGLRPPVWFVGFASNKNTQDIPRANMRITKDDEWPPCAYGDVISDHGFKELVDEDPNIPQIKIDTFTQLVEPPDIISLDVEGSEFEVLRGAEQTLREHKPLIYLSLHPEFMFRMFGEYSGDLRNWIKDIGYEETFLDWQHEAHFLYTPVKEVNG